MAALARTSGQRAGGQILLPEVHAVGAPASSARSKRSFTMKRAPACAGELPDLRAPRRAPRDPSRAWRAAAPPRRRPRRRPAPARRGSCCQRGSSSASTWSPRSAAREHRLSDAASLSGRAGSSMSSSDDLLAQRVAVDSEQRRRADLVAVGPCEHGLDQGPFHPLQHRAVESRRLRARRARPRPRRTHQLVEVCAAASRSRRSRRGKRSRRASGRRRWRAPARA